MVKSIFITAFTLAIFNCGHKPIKPEKIIFHTGSCFGTCPVYHLQIDNTKKVKLYAEKVYAENASLGDEGDTTKMGHFTGTLNTAMYNKLVQEIQAARIDTMHFNEEACCDAPVKTLIIYYNGKRKYLQSMFPPKQANQLITTLNEICETNKFKRTREKFEIEYQQKAK